MPRAEPLKRNSPAAVGENALHVLEAHRAPLEAGTRDIANLVVDDLPRAALRRVNDALRLLLAGLESKDSVALVTFSTTGRPTGMCSSLAVLKRRLGVLRS